MPGGGLAAASLVAMHGRATRRYASARMLATTTDAPNLPLVIGLPFLLMFVTAVIIFAVYWGLGRMGTR